MMRGNKMADTTRNAGFASGITLPEAEEISLGGSLGDMKDAVAPRPVPKRPAVTRDENGRIQVEGRDGEILTRSRVVGSDPYHIPTEIIPKGWAYQWNAVTIYNNQDLLVGQAMAMASNGWRPVPAHRHPGMFVPVGTKGAIIRDGLRLEERPAVMNEEARAEEISNAKRLISDRNESLMLSGVKSGMPSGFEMSGKYRGTGGRVVMDIDRGLDIPESSHTLAGPED
jgi:hypothetical protein